MPGVETFVASRYSPIASATVVGLLLVFSLLAYLCCEDSAGSTAIRASQEVAREVRSRLSEPERVSRHQAKGSGSQAKEPGEIEYSKGTRATAELIKLMEPSPVGGERVEDKRILLYDRIFGEPEQGMPVIEKMIFENATAECRTAIVLRKNKRLQDWLRACCGPGWEAVCAYSTGENNSIWVPTWLVQIVKNEARLQDDDSDSPDTDVRFGDKYTTMGHS